MTNLKFIVRLFWAYLGRFKLLIVFGGMFGALLFVTVNYLSPLLFGRSNQSIGITGRFHPEELPSEVLLKVSEGLTLLADDGSVLPSLAESWESEDNGKTWTFRLAKGKLWQDGTPVTSETIKYSFEDVEIQRPDDGTIVFVLKEPFSPFPVVVARPTFKKGLLGTGEWEITRLSQTGSFVERVVLKNRENERLTYKFYPTEEATKLAFKLGEVATIEDIIDPMPFESWEVTSLEKKVNFNRFVALFFNHENEAFGGRDAKEIRQALSYAIDKSHLGERALGPISPTSWAYNPQIKPYDFDRVRASELLPKETKEKLEITISTTPVLLKTAEKIVEDWKAVGIKSKVQVISSIPESYQTLLVIYDIPADPDQYPIWHSTQKGTNIAKYNNERIDKLLEDGRIVLDKDERRKIYLDFQRFLLEDAPAAFLYHPVSYTISRK